MNNRSLGPKIKAEIKKACSFLLSFAIIYPPILFKMIAVTSFTVNDSQKSS